MVAYWRWIYRSIFQERIRDNSWYPEDWISSIFWELWWTHTRLNGVRIEKTAIWLSLYNDRDSQGSYAVKLSKGETCCLYFHDVVCLEATSSPETAVNVYQNKRGHIQEDKSVVSTFHVMMLMFDDVLRLENFFSAASFFFTFVCVCVCVCVWRIVSLILIFKNNVSLVGFQVLTAVIMKNTVSWDITPCSPLKVNLRFGDK
jgi:hypothetical protein